MNIERKVGVIDTDPPASPVPEAGNFFGCMGVVPNKKGLELQIPVLQKVRGTQLHIQAEGVTVVIDLIIPGCSSGIKKGPSIPDLG